MDELRVRISPELWHFVRAAIRGAEVVVSYDGTASVGHVVESLGVPLTEVGDIRREGDIVHVSAVARPQVVPGGDRFVLDVHLGKLARRLRLVGVDTAYRNQMEDAELVEQANGERRVLLTQDRRLLMRRALWLGAYVCGDDADDQLADVLERFTPPLNPWTRCVACNGELTAVQKDEIADRLQPGTRRTYDTFARCRNCDRLYWRGAHNDRLEEIVNSARQPRAND